MRFIGFALSIVAMATLLVPGAPALAQPGVSEVLEKRFQAEAPPAQTEILQAVLDFAPGAWTPLHTHGGWVYVTVLDGAVTLRQSGIDRAFTVGEGWIDSKDEPHLAGNDTATVARVVATFVLPKGATPTTVAETGAAGDLPPGPTTFAQHRFDAPGLPPSLDVVHRVLEVASGAQVPMHSHPGMTVVTTVRGSGTLTETGGAQPLNPGESWVEPADHVHGGILTASSPVHLVAAHLVPRGAPHTVPAGPAPAAAQPVPMPAPVQMPRTR